MFLFFIYVYGVNVFVIFEESIPEQKQIKKYTKISVYLSSYKQFK